MHKHLTLMEKTEKCRELLLSTGRPNIEKLLAHIKDLGYFIAPGSYKHHRFEGGLVSHSLETYEEAMRLRQRKIEQGVNPSLMPVESVIIAALMHDLCKADELRFSRTGRLVYSLIKEYEGHSRKSVRQVGKSGFRLTEMEKDAILWHMGGKKMKESRREHFRKYPLSEIIFYADKNSIHAAKIRHHENI